MLRGSIWFTTAFVLWLQSALLPAAIKAAVVLTVGLSASVPHPIKQLRARAATGRASAAPPTSVMNSYRALWRLSRRAGQVSLGLVARLEYRLGQ